MKKPADKQRRASAGRAVSRVQAVEACLSDEAARELEHRFLDKFAVCEAGYKSILGDWLKHQGKTVKKEDLKIKSEQTASVLRFAGVELDNDTRKIVFGGLKTHGKKGARALRNDIAHEPNERDLQEVSSAFMSSMKRWMSFCMR